MCKKQLFNFIGLIFLLISLLILQAWGFYGHRKINHMAVFVLPPPMLGFYKHHINYLSSHSVDADKRRYATEVEAPRHYIDIDHFAKNGEDPFEVMPQDWEKALEKFTEDTLIAYGINPWHIYHLSFDLTRAFQSQDEAAILRLSADLGHYISDAHVPLHTTENYNGQLSGQKGIHGLWESRIPELSGFKYNYLIGKAEYIQDIQKFIWGVIQESHALVYQVLLLEKKLDSKFPSDEKYSIEKRGMSNSRQYAKAYALEYENILDGMVESRMRLAIKRVASVWYTCWLNAGQPQLILNQSGLMVTALDSLTETRSTLEIKGREHPE